MTGVIIVSMLLATAQTEAAGEVRERGAIDERYKWDLSLMYSGEDAWNAHFREVDAMIERLAGLKGTTGQSPEALASVLDLRDQINIQLEKLQAFAFMNRDQDVRQSSAQALDQRATSVAVKYGTAVSWLEPELLQIPRATLQEWLKGDRLKVYAHYFDNLFRTAEHILSPREEELLAMSQKATGAAYDAFTLLTNAELRWRKMTDRDGKTIEISPATFYRFLYSKNRDERRDAYLGFSSSYIDVKNTLAATLAGSAQRDWFYAKARGYGSALEASLDAENLPVPVYHRLIETVNRHLPLLHRFTALKKKVLGLSEIHPYDLYVSLVDMPERQYDYETACQLVLEGIQPLGPEYVQMMRQGFNSRWIDVFENKGKRSGAYNMGTYLSPPYVLLNFNGTYNDVSTIAHEMGHAMQSYFTQTSQPPVYAGYPMFTAEVASTAAEIIFKQYLLDRSTDPREQAWMIDTMLENIRTTVFRQTKFAEFDLAIHEMVERDEPLTAEGLMQLSRELFQKYYGSELVLDPESDVECLRIPHYYRNFYVYRYATSYSAASALAKRIMTDPAAVDDFMKFLRIGNSMYAMDMLKVAGVDMTSPQPVEDCMLMFGELLDRLEALLAKLS